jgi:RNA polymerase sigma factor (sigma-70 family)
MYEELLKQNRGLIAWAARRYAGAIRKDNAIDMDDLLQAGFIGLVNAGRTYNASTGGSWSQWVLWHIQREYNALLGLRDGRFTKAHSGAISLDAPISEDYDETALDYLEDTNLEPVDAAALLDDDRRVVREAVADLKDDRQREIVERWQLNGETQSEVAKSLGISSERVRQLWRRSQKILARDQRLRQLAYLADCAPVYRPVSVAQFERTRTSQTERAALWLIEHEVHHMIEDTDEPKK